MNIMWLLLVFRNLKSFIRTKPVLFFFMILSQVVCVVSALAVAGMVDAVTPVPEDKRGYSSLSFFLEFNRNTENKTEQKNGVSLFDIKQKKFLYVGEDNEEAEKIRQSIRNTPSENDIYESNFLLSAKSPPFLTYGNMKEKINTVRESCQNELASIHFGGYIEEDGLVSVHFKAEKHDNEWLKKNRPYLYGKSHQISLRRNPYYESPFQKLSVGDTVTVGHTEYIVSHIENGDAWNIATALTINPEAADDSFIINYVTFTVKSETNQAGIAKVSKAIQDAFGELSPYIEEPQPPPLMEKQFNHMVYVLSFIIIAVVILNVARLYTYVMASRKKALAIFSVCGAGRIRIFALCTAEIGLTLLVSFGLGWLLFHFVLTEPITAIYPTFAEFFTPRIYLMLFGIYLVTGLIIMTVNIIPTIRQSIHDRTKGGE